MKPLNLNRRERYYVAAGAGVVILLLILELVIFPLLNKRERLSRVLAEKTTELQEMRSLQSEYLALEKNAQRAKAELARRDKNFSVLSYLPSLAGEVGINVSKMVPSSSVVAGAKVTTVELRINTITMDQLARYLYQVEYSGNNLFVKRMSISQTSKPEGYIDVVLQVQTIES